MYNENYNILPRKRASQKPIILILIGLLGISMYSCNNCQKLKSRIETDYVIIYNGNTFDTLGTLTMSNNTYDFTFNQSFPDSLKKFAPPFIFIKPRGLYKWKSDLETSALIV